MAMEALGRTLAVVPVAAGVYLKLADWTGVTFACYGADTFTLKSATTADGAGAASLPVITDYYTQTATNGSVPYVDTSQVPGPSVTVAAGHVAVFEVTATDLPAAAKYVGVTVAASGLVVAVVHDPQVQRDPGSLAALAA